MTEFTEKALSELQAAIRKATNALPHPGSSVAQELENAGLHYYEIQFVARRLQKIDAACAKALLHPERSSA